MTARTLSDLTCDNLTLADMVNNPFTRHQAFPRALKHINGNEHHVEVRVYGKRVGEATYMRPSKTWVLTLDGYAGISWEGANLGRVFDTATSHVQPGEYTYASAMQRRVPGIYRVHSTKSNLVYLIETFYQTTHARGSEFTHRRLDDKHINFKVS